MVSNNGFLRYEEKENCYWPFGEMLVGVSYSPYALVGVSCHVLK